MKSYEESMAYIKSLEKLGSVLGLNSIRHLMDKLDNPQDKIGTVHVAGTNGKGSVIAYLEAVLTNAGYKVGKYISPSVEDYWERIQINGKSILPKQVAELAGIVRTACGEMVAEGLSHPTVFEFETAMAFEFFWKEQVDIALIETGMGGAEDATNVIAKPLCEVLTSISLDHVGILGNNIQEITVCKAGIIMEDTDVVLYGGNPVVNQIVAKVAGKKHARLTITDVEGIFLKERLCYGRHKDIRVGLRGEHQMKNAAVVLDTLEILSQKGFHISEEHIQNGLSQTQWPGRFETLKDSPVQIVIDGAHNEEAAVQLRKAILDYYPDYTRFFVMGVFADKDYPKIIELTNDLASEIITINPHNPRALDSKKLKQAIDERKKERSLQVTACDEAWQGVRYAIEAALKCKDPKKVIIVFGSLSFLGEVKNYVQECFSEEK